MTTFVNQYRTLFFLSWIILYLIIPAWAFPVSVITRAFVYFGLLIYFAVSAAVLSHWITIFTVDSPPFMKIKNWRELVKEHLWLIILCIIAMILNIYPAFSPILIMGDETIHLQSGLWVYDYLDSSWHTVFQSIFWIVVVILLVVRTFKDKLNKYFSDFLSHSFQKKLAVVLFFGLLTGYFLLLKDITYTPTLIRYPPVSKFVYFLAYSAFGIHHVFPRLVQLLFYVLSSIYIYRTISLFHYKNASLVGAALYLFLPISFAYAHLGELASGTVFFMAAVSFYFLRFIKEGNNRDLIISAYLIGIAGLYKKLHLLMYIVCFIFLIAQQLKKREFRSLNQFKILSLAMVPIVPWMLFTRNYSWRNYTFVLDNLTSLDSKIVTYFTLMFSNMSPVIFVFFLGSVIYVFYRQRTVLTAYFGLLFAVYYFFIVSDMGGLSPRFSLVFYPTIIVYVSLFISRIIQSIRWKHAFNVCFGVLVVYLIIISAVAPFNKYFLTLIDRKLIAFPSSESMKWVKDNVKENEKVLIMRIMSANFYRVKYAIDRSRIDNFWYVIKDIDTPEKLTSYYKKNKISYIIFPYSPYPYSSDFPILEYLKENGDNKFMEVATFNLEDNYIFIYKLKNI